MKKPASHIALPGAGAAGHFHIFAALRTLRYGLLLCLVPMARALIVFDLPALFLALRQDAFILALCVGAALWLWANTFFCAAQNAVEVRRGFFFEDVRVYTARSVAAVEITRPLLYRFFGAAKLTLYFSAQKAPHTCALTLKKKDAQKLAETLLPAYADNAAFRPAGFEKLALVMLSANVLTSWVFIGLSAKRVSDVLGTDWRALAQWNLTQLEVLFERFLPAGTALLTALVFLLASVTLFVTCLRTAGFSVCRSGGVLFTRGGLLTKTERRIRVQCITACDVRVTPAARLLRWYPVYVTAGSYSGGELPLVVCRKNGEELRRLVPSYTPAQAPLCTPRRKSLVQYVWKPGIVAILSFLLVCTAAVQLPKLTVVLAVPLVLSLLCAAVGVDGFFHEGAAGNANRTLSLCYTRFFTRHNVCILTQDRVYDTYQHPIALSAGRADFTVHLPCGVQYKVRGIVQYTAHRMPLSQ